MCTGMEPAMIAALWGTAATTALTMYSTDTAANQEEANFKWQAAQAQADANAEAGAATVEANRIRKASKAQRAKAVAAAAASGIDVNSPTAIKIDEEITANAEEDAVLTMLQGSDRAARLNQQAHADRNSASIVRSGSRVSQTATLLSGASSMVSTGGDAWKRSRAKGG